MEDQPITQEQPLDQNLPVSTNPDYAGQYNVGPVQTHTHNGTDSSRISSSSVMPLTSGYYLTEIDNGKSSTAATINWNNGNKQKLTTTGSCTLSFINPQGPCNLIFRIVHTTNATSYTYTWPASVKWSGGVALSTTNSSGAIDIIALYFDGITYYASGLTNFS